MVIIGELINTSRKKIGEAVEAGDVAYLQQVAKDQVEAGAHYLDVNCGTMIGKEPETLEWLVKLVQEVVDVPLCLDSPDPAALERALGAHKGTA
ncbi:MAG: dihydropteroate synthase, partial [Firmicutes bacterium]|nr:dihydropteroate synthase [Bacillota bacterium]